MFEMDGIEMFKEIAPRVLSDAADLVEIVHELRQVLNVKGK